jgi:SAM-dependent methyltransferase
VVIKKRSDQFLDPRKSLGNLDRYLIRSSILGALLSQREKLIGRLLDVGCGNMPYKKVLLESGGGKATEYLGLDLANNPVHQNQPDLLWEGEKIPLDSDSVDSALLTEVLEHVPNPDVILTEIMRVLRPGGKLFLTVPFLWPLHEVPYDNYRYTPFALRRHLEESGFTVMELRATGGWDASLAQMIGLWVKRSPLGRVSRRILALLLFPFYLWLLRRDRKRPASKFGEGTMLTGLWGLAEKPVSEETGNCR